MKVRQIVVDSGLGLLATVLLFGLLELVFWAGDVGAADRTHLGSGVVGNEVFLRPDPGREGGWIPEYQGGKSSPRPIPPKGEARRVLLFGGSNTRSFQHGKLPQALQVAGQGQEYEVVNLGRSGWGSERVRRIYAQALDRLEPDVCVIYAGHNELTEAGFAMDVEANWSSDWMRSAGELALRSRTVNLLAAGMTEEESGSGRSWESEYTKYQGIHFEQTRRFYRHYEENLREMCADAQRRGIEVVLCTLIYNRFSVPFASNYAPDVPEERRDKCRRFYVRARKSMPDFLQQILVRESYDNLRLHFFDWGRSREAGLMGVEGELERELPGQRESLGALAAVDPLWGDVRSEKVFTFYAALERLHAARASGELDLRPVEKLLARALGLVPDHPHALFALGLV